MIDAPAEAKRSRRSLAKTLAAFHPPNCMCGRRTGICYDLAMIIACDRSPNETLLHELTHAWQYALDPKGSTAAHEQEIRDHGYWNAPFEIEARKMAAAMHAAGVQVYFPAS